MNSKKRIIVKYLTTFCFIGIIVTLVLMMNWTRDVKTNSQTQHNIEKYINTDKSDEIDIDFDELRNINSDTVGYIEIPNTNVKYVVVKGNDN